jgi:hypothetical protein
LPLTKFWSIVISMGKKENQRRWYLSHREEHKRTVALNRWVKRQENKAKVEQYLKDHSCVGLPEYGLTCTVTDPEVLQFDHVRGRKRLEVSRMVCDGYSWAIIEAEIDKCVVRCANCHMKRTNRQRREKMGRCSKALAELRVRSSVGRAGGS